MVQSGDKRPDGTSKSLDTYRTSGRDVGAKDTILTLAHIGCLIHIVECSLRNNYILQAPVLLGGGGGAAAGGTMSQECLAAVLLQVRKVLNLQYCTVTIDVY